jgi:protein-disulfide isomerase
MPGLSKLSPVTSTILLVSFGLAMLYWLGRDSAQPQRSSYSGINQMKVTKSELLKNVQFLSEHDSNTKFVLVEYGDYQCEPCRQLDGKLKKVLASCDGKIALCFRNYPISAIHPLAFEAAIVAQSSKDKAQFEKVHEAFYERPLKSRQDIEAIKAKFGITIRPFAFKSVEGDIDVAKKASIDSTPSLFLCALSGVVYEVLDLDEVAEFVNEAPFKQL